jgi:arginyl-tRNA synthetase
MLSFEGETAPYLQYTHARSCSILRKALKEHNTGSSDHINYESFGLAEEKEVINLLYKFPEVIVQVAKTYKPHHLANYLIALAQKYNEFYHKCPVISDRRNTMKARLLLVDCVRQVLENGLNLLGIKAPDEM